MMYLEDVITICEGEAPTGTLNVSQNKKNPRDLDVTVQYSFSGKRSQASMATFPDEVTEDLLATCVVTPMVTEETMAVGSFLSRLAVGLQRSIICLTWQHLCTWPFILIGCGRHDK